MFDELPAAVRVAIMSILSALYESGLVEEVDLSDIVRLFGVSVPDMPITGISFRDPGWIDAYINFREVDPSEIADFIMDFEVDQTSMFESDFDESDFDEGFVDPLKKFH